MAGNFWKSSHYQQWLLDKRDLLHERQTELTDDEYQKIFIFYTTFIQSLGEHLKIRQQVVATATIYFRRFYAKYSLKCVDPLLMAVTSLFLASKVEEFGAVPNTKFFTSCQHIAKQKYAHAFNYQGEFPYRMPAILECEFFLLEALDCCLIVYHPYRPLMQYVSDLQEQFQLQSEEQQLLPFAWKVVNDSYRTDVCLLYPPYLTAIAALYVTCVVKQIDAHQWFAELNIDLEKVLEITRELMRLYDVLKTFDEKKELPMLLNKMPKPRTSPSRPPSQGPGVDSSSANGQSQTHFSPANQQQ